MKIKAVHLPQRRSRFIVALSGIYFIMLLACFPACTTSPSGPKQTDYQCPATPDSSGPVTLTMYYSSEKEAWINDVVGSFNKLQKTACNGPITVIPKPIGSGLSEQQILAGNITPDIWSPANSLWLNVLGQEWLQRYHTKIISTGAHDTPSLLLSPVVIAMWRPEAQALGWPKTPLGWADIASFGTDPQSRWATFVAPQWGRFKFTHTRPDLSNSGLDTLIAENYVGAKERKVLTLDDVNNQATREFVANAESSVIYYSDERSTSSDYIAGKMFCNDFHKLSAAVMYENLVVEGNAGNVSLNGKPCPRLNGQVVAIYPKEGTFYSDHPFVIPQAKWVTPDKKAAAIVFRDFLLEPDQQREAIKYGFRSINSDVKISTTAQATDGIDLSQPTIILQIPPVDVVEQIQAAWLEERRSAQVMLLLDHSGSMNNNDKLDAAKQGLLQFIDQLGDLDEAGLTIFNPESTVLLAVMSLGSNNQRQKLRNQIPTIQAFGGSCLYEAIDQQVQALAALPIDRHLKALVVLTDGKEEDCPLNPPDCIAPQCLTPDSLVKRIAPTGVEVFTIAYGNDANKSVLSTIAAGTGGEEVDATPANIKDVYVRISQLL